MQVHPVDSRYSILFPRHFSLSGLDPPHRQGWQIVQSRLTLDDSLP